MPLPGEVEVVVVAVVFVIGGDVMAEVVVGVMVFVVDTVVVIGSPSTATQYDWPEALKFPHVAVMDGF